MGDGIFDYEASKHAHETRPNHEPIILSVTMITQSSAYGSFGFKLVVLDKYNEGEARTVG